VNVIFQKVQTVIKSKIPKIICGILATISIPVIGFILLPSFWFWVCWEIVAAGLVAVGCCGEWYMFFNPAKEGHESHHRRRELQFITAVAIGVFMEFLALGHAIPEVMRLEKDVAVSKERTEQLVSKNLVLRSNVVALEIRLQPRTITLKQITNFIFLTEKITKIPIVVRAAPGGEDTESYAFQIRTLLNFAHFGIPANADNWGIIRDDHKPVFARPIGINDEWADIHLICGSNGIARFPDFNYEITNGFTRPIVSDDSVVRIYNAIFFCFQQMKMKVGWSTNANWIKPGGVEFVIAPKNN